VAAASVFAGQELVPGAKLGLNGLLPHYNIYQTKDGSSVALGALEPKFWQEFCLAVGRPDLIERGYAEGADRDRLFEELRTLFLSKTRVEWLAQLNGRDLCVEPVLSLSEAISHPQVQHREIIAAIEHPREGMIRQINPPFRLSATPATIRSAAPRLGEHTGEVLQSLGYTEQELKELRGAGVI
jgi:alpha-methylacyl-CoA racemase